MCRILLGLSCTVVHLLRDWTKTGLLKVHQALSKGYQLWNNRKGVPRGGGGTTSKRNAGAHGYVSDTYPNQFGYVPKCLVSIVQNMEKPEHIPRTHRCAWRVSTDASFFLLSRAIPPFRLFRNLNSESPMPKSQRFLPARLQNLVSDCLWFLQGNLAGNLAGISWDIFGPT